MISIGNWEFGLSTLGLSGIHLWCISGVGVGNQPNTTFTFPGKQTVQESLRWEMWKVLVVFVIQNRPSTKSKQGRLSAWRLHCHVQVTWAQSLKHPWVWICLLLHLTFSWLKWIWCEQSQAHSSACSSVAQSPRDKVRTHTKRFSTTNRTVLKPKCSLPQDPVQLCAFWTEKKFLSRIDSHTCASVWKTCHCGQLLTLRLFEKLSL